MAGARARARRGARRRAEPRRRATLATGDMLDADRLRRAPRAGATSSSTPPRRSRRAAAGRRFAARTSRARATRSPRRRARERAARAREQRRRVRRRERYRGRRPAHRRGQRRSAAFAESAFYARSKRESEELVMEAQRAGRLWATAVRPVVIYGTHDRQFVPRLARMLRRGFAPLIGGGRTTLAIVHAANVADGMVRAAAHDGAGGRRTISRTTTTSRCASSSGCAARGARTTPAHRLRSRCSSRASHSARSRCVAPLAAREPVQGGDRRHRSTSSRATIRSPPSARAASWGGIRRCVPRRESRKRSAGGRRTTDARKCDERGGTLEWCAAPRRVERANEAYGFLAFTRRDPSSSAVSIFMAAESIFMAAVSAAARSRSHRRGGGIGLRGSPSCCRRRRARSGDKGQALHVNLLRVVLVEMTRWSAHASGARLAA